MSIKHIIMIMIIKMAKKSMYKISVINEKKNLLISINILIILFKLLNYVIYKHFYKLLTTVNIFCLPIIFCFTILTVVLIN